MDQSRLGDPSIELHICRTPIFDNDDETMTDPTHPPESIRMGQQGPLRIDRDAAARALAEADVRRAGRDAEAVARPRELNGRAGPEPVRYGDWEVKGLACDF